MTLSEGNNSSKNNAAKQKSPDYSDLSLPGREMPLTSDYDDDNIPEIDLPGKASATNVIPDEVPRRDGPGGN